MAYDNLPHINSQLLDGNLVFAESSADPIYVVIGTATQGVTDQLYPVRRLNDAKRLFGTSGTLIRGMYEANAGGAKNIRLLRIGATSAKLETVGGGITIETVAKDDSAGTQYKIFYEDSSGRVRIWRASDDTLVYDNNPAYPLQAIDLGELAVSGAKSGSNGDIGSISTPITLAAAHNVSGASYTAGTDGASLSRMKLYEELHKAYYLLEDQVFDQVDPKNIYLDDLNVMDLTAAEISTLGLTSLSDYPSAGASTDALGKVHIEEYEGEFHFWWWFPTDPTNQSFSAAQIYPTAGSADASTGADGTTLTAADFHEVNFAYQLATFLHKMSTDVVDVVASIGVKPPTSFAPKDLARWVGKEPVTELNLTTGNTVISTNGTGLLGNKFMAGRKTASGLNGLTINGVDGLFGGGFIATDSGFLDGTQLKDDNDALIDIGKYLSIVATYVTVSNASMTSSYTTTGSSVYSGFHSALPPNVSPLNKVLNMVLLPHRISSRKIDKLVGSKYVTFHSKPKGIVVSDAPTAARKESDYTQLTTVKIVKAVVDAIREGTDPFIGGGLSDLKMQALETRIETILNDAVKDDFLQRYDKVLSATVQQKVLGEALLELTLVPVFTWRKLTIVVSLAKA